MDNKIDIGKEYLRFKDIWGVYGRFKNILSNYIFSELLQGIRGDFYSLYVQGKPIKALLKAVSSLEYVYSDIFPAIDNVYDLGKPYLKFRNLWASYGYFTTKLFIQGYEVTIPLPILYLIQELNSIAYFYQQALDQLYTLFAEDVKEIKVMISEQLARELYETKTIIVDTSKETPPKILPFPDPLHQLIIRNWYIVTDSGSGEIELRSVIVYDPIIWLPCIYVKQARNEDLWIELYYDDYLQLIWRYLEPYSKIMLQISILQKYIGTSIR